MSIAEESELNWLI